jgi:hypothetical protein
MQKRLHCCTIATMTVVDRAEKKADLLKQVVDLVERLHTNEVEHEQLLRQRDENCRELKAAGASIKELEEALGVSRSRVQQVLRRSTNS